MDDTMSFGEALNYLKRDVKGKASITIKGWYGSEAKPIVKLQRPDEHSKMTKPYLYMTKNEGKDVFPLDLSCESILSDEWVIVS